MTRATESRIATALKAARKAGETPREVIILPNGEIRVRLTEEAGNGADEVFGT